jgi:hypothetical protein
MLVDEGNGFSKKQAEEEVFTQVYSNRNLYYYFKIRAAFEMNETELNLATATSDPMITPPPGQRIKPSQSSNSGSMGPPEWPHILYERENDPYNVYM